MDEIEQLRTENASLRTREAALVRALEESLAIFDDPNRANFGDAVRILRQAALKQAGAEGGGGDGK